MRDYEFEERAAIIEFDGKIPTDVAELLAKRDFENIKKENNND